MSRDIDILVLYYSVKMKGLGGFLGELAFHPFPKWMAPVNLRMNALGGTVHRRTRAWVEDDQLARDSGRRTARKTAFAGGTQHLPENAARIRQIEPRDQ